MKFSKIAVLLLVLGVVFFACEDTNENPVKQRGVNIVPNIEFISAPVFTTDFTNSSIEFKVELNKGDEVDGGSIEVLFNGENAVTMQEITSFPAVIQLSAADIISKMGLDANKVIPSDVFTVYVLTKKNGNVTRSLAASIIKIVCAYNTDLIKGDYHVISEDWEVEGDVVITADEGDPYKVYVSGLNTLDGVSGVSEVFFEIDPATFNITNKSKFIMSEDLEEDWGDDCAGYTNYTYEIAKGSYNSCDGSYELVFKIYCDAGDFGEYKFVFTLPEKK